jgi:hypothetical protein
MPAQANSLRDPISKKTFTKKGLVEWLKVYALSSNPSTAKRKGRKRNCKESRSFAGQTTPPNEENYL